MIAGWRKTFKTALVLTAALPAFSAAAGEVIRPVDREADIDRVIHRMEQVRKDIEDLVAVIDHTSVSRPGGPETVTRITLAYKSPDKLRNEIEGGREVLVNGDRMWVYSPDLQVAEEYHLRDEDTRRATIYEMSWGLTSPIRVLLRGTQRFSTRLEDGTHLVTVIPDQAEAEIDRIRAWVDPESWLIERMEISPRDRPRIELAIREWKINSGLTDSDFEFSLPEGADLFEPLETGGEIIQ